VILTALVAYRQLAHGGHRPWERPISRRATTPFYLYRVLGNYLNKFRWIRLGRGTWYEPAARKGVECRLGGSIIKIASTQGSDVAEKLESGTDTAVDRGR
jgi:hypothetical protein